jgi:hypothetical protein
MGNDIESCKSKKDQVSRRDIENALNNNKLLTIPQNMGIEMSRIELMDSHNSYFLPGVLIIEIDFPVLIKEVSLIEYGFRKIINEFPNSNKIKMKYNLIGGGVKDLSITYLIIKHDTVKDWGEYNLPYCIRAYYEFDKIEIQSFLTKYDVL